MSLRVEIKGWKEARKAAEPIRYAIFLAEKNAQGVEVDGVDPQSAHALAYDESGSTVVGTGRLLPDGQIGRLAVLKDWRRHGFVADGKIVKEAGLLQQRMRKALARP